MAEKEEEPITVEESGNSEESGKIEESEKVEEVKVEENVKVEETPEASATEEPPPSTETNTGETNPPEAAGSQAVTKDKTKIDIFMKATGNTPIMKKKKWAVAQDQTIAKIAEFCSKYLKLDPDERLFLYINQTFAPAPDQTMKNLYDCYGTNGILTIHYCKSQAWG
ncbi:autophagy protein 12-like [Orussus abietinus]|uniref:autophagy protein 12-like n=1 Tax=Orussus abietinus TaxID=222816 RepID=UPI00062577BA|nr:autophagy protein 12-like [Orussus abietinus]